MGHVLKITISHPISSLLFLFQWSKYQDYYFWVCVNQWFCTCWFLYHLLAWVIRLSNLLTTFRGIVWQGLFHWLVIWIESNKEPGAVCQISCIALNGVGERTQRCRSRWKQESCFLFRSLALFWAHRCCYKVQTGKIHLSLDICNVDIYFWVVILDPLHSPAVYLILK